MKTTSLKISAGHSAAALAVIGWLGRLLVMGVLQNSGTRFETASFALLAAGGFAEVFLLAAGALGIYGIVRNDGREPAIVALVLAALFVATFIFGLVA